MPTFALRRIAGTGFDGSSVTTTFGKAEVPIIKADYGDSLESAFLSYLGSQENDEQSPGSYKTNPLKITVSAMVFRVDILPAFPDNGFGMLRLPIIIGRTHPEAGSDSDLLLDCRCTNLAAATENSNKLEETTLEFTIRQIKWSKARKTINQVRKAGGLASFSKF